MTNDDKLCGHVEVRPDGAGLELQIDHQVPYVLQHYYPLPGLGQAEIPLYEGTFGIKGKGTYEGNLSLRMVPRPTLWYVGERDVSIDELNSILNPSDFVWMDALELEVETSGHIPPPPIGLAASKARPPAGRGRFSDHVGKASIGVAEQLDRVKFFVLNGWTTLNAKHACDSGTIRLNVRLHATCDGWSVRIARRPDIGQDDISRHMRATTTQTVTHIGRICRVDGSQFFGR